MWNRQYTHDTLNSSRMILIVEDNVTLGYLLLEALQDATIYQVSLATNAERAIALLQTMTPALLLLKHPLPGMNGLELVNYLQRTARGKHIPLILISDDLPPNMCQRKHIRRLSKPFDLDTLLHLVAEMMEPGM